MSDSCNNDRPPFTTMLDFKDLVCDEWVFWVLFVLAIGVQILRNYVWIWNSQATRVALQFDPGSKERNNNIRKLLAYTAFSFLLYVFAFLIIVGGNVWFLLAVLIGNMGGTYFGMKDQPADCGKGATRELEEFIPLVRDFNEGKITDEKEKEELIEFAKLLQQFIASSANVPRRFNSTGFKF